MLTSGVRFYGAAVSLLILLLNAKFLGARGVGIYSLAILAVAFYQNVIGFVTGAIPYWTPRKGSRNIVLASLFWIFVAVGVCTPVFYILGMIPEGLLTGVVFLALLHGLHGLFQNIAVGENNIAQFNRVLVLTHSFVIVTVVLGFFVWNQKNVRWVINAMLIGYGLGVAYNVIFWSKKLKRETTDSVFQILKQLLHHGTYVQVANFFQQINYRLTFYFVEAFAGVSVLGLYAAGIQLSEGVWNLSKSFAVVEYGAIANTEDRQVHRKTVRHFALLSIIGTAVLLAILLAIPEHIWVYFLGQDFAGVKEVIVWLSPGVLVFSLSTIVSHYFTGVGRFWENTIASGIGVPVTLVGCWLLIREYDLVGAAMTQNISYAISLGYLFWAYRRRISQ